MVLLEGGCDTITICNDDIFVVEVLQTRFLEGHTILPSQRLVVSFRYKWPTEIHQEVSDCERKGQRGICKINCWGDISFTTWSLVNKYVAGQNLIFSKSPDLPVSKAWTPPRLRPPPQIWRKKGGTRSLRPERPPLSKMAEGPSRPKAQAVPQESNTVEGAVQALGPAGPSKRGRPKPGGRWGLQCRFAWLWRLNICDFWQQFSHFSCLQECDFEESNNAKPVWRKPECQLTGERILSVSSCVQSRSYHSAMLIYIKFGNVNRKYSCTSHTKLFCRRHWRMRLPPQISHDAGLITGR